MAKATQHPFDILQSFEQRARVRAASPEMEAESAMVGRLALRFADQRIMVSMEDISQIVPAPVITPVPGVKPWLIGIANLRGTVISVVNLGDFLLGKPSLLGKRSRIVTVASGDWYYGLLIDEVVGMRHFAEHSKVGLDVVPEPLRPYVDEVYNSEDRHWMTFSIDALLANAYFLDAAA